MSPGCPPALLPEGAGKYSGCRFPHRRAGNAPLMVRPQFRLRASFFLLVQKETKDTLRGSASGSVSAPKGGALLTVGPPPKNPRFTGE